MKKTSKSLIYTEPKRDKWIKMNRILPVTETAKEQDLLNLMQNRKK